MSTPGYVTILGPSGRRYTVPAGRKAAVLAAVPGSSEVKPQRATLGSVVSGLADKSNYASPQRMGEIGKQAGQAAYDLTAQNGPMLGSILATLPLGGIGGIAGVGARTAAAGMGAYGGSIAGDVMQGQAPDLNAAAQQVGPNMAFAGGGEGIGAGGDATARGLTRRWARPTPAMIEESPHLIDDLLSTRAKYRRGGKPAKEPLGAKEQSMAATRGMVAGSPKTITLDDALKQVIEMRDRISSYAPTDARLPEINDFINGFEQKWGNGPIPVEDAHMMKKESQTEASWSSGSNEPATRKLMHKMVAQDVRQAIGREVAKPRGFKHGYNEQDEMTHRYHEAADATERAGTLGPTQAPLMSHIAPDLIAGTAGSHAGPYGAAGGALGAEIVQRALENPYVANRLALLLSSGWGKALLRNAPRAGQAVVPKGKK